MPGTNGIEVTRRILEAGPQSEVGILMLTMFEDDDSVLAAMRAGVRGYVLKGADGAETFGPSAPWPGARPSSDPRSPDAVLRRTRTRSRGDTRAFPELTEREHDILALIARGYTNTAIADRLYLSPKTVRNYVSSIFAKLQVADRAGAIVRAREAGLGRENP